MSKELQIEKDEDYNTMPESKPQSMDIIEIDLAEKAEDIWQGRRTILMIVGLFFALGYFHTKFGPTEYDSTASLIQESEGATVGEFGSSFLQSLTGISIPSGTGNLSAAATGRAPLPVSLYPRIISSTEFQKELIHTELEFSELDTTITLYDYYQNLREPSLRDKVYSLVGDMTIYLPFTLYDWARSSFRNGKELVAGFSGSGSGTTGEQHPDQVQFEDEIDDRLQSVTREEKAVIEWMKLRIILMSEGGVMDITTTLPDPKAAALANAILVGYIQDYIIDYRLEKARQNLEAVLEQYEEAKQRYEEAQAELAQYRDENINISTQQARIEETRLVDQERLRFNVYNSISQQVEQSRLVIQQQMPVFNILEKPNIPLSPSTGSSALLMVFAGVLGLFFGVGVVLIRNSSFVN